MRRGPAWQEPVPQKPVPLELLLSVAEAQAAQLAQGRMGQGRVWPQVLPGWRWVLQGQSLHQGGQSCNLLGSQADLASARRVARVGAGRRRWGGGGVEVGLPWAEGKEENQLGGNYPAVGSGAHYAVFIEQLLIPRSGINPFQPAAPAWRPGKGA